VSDIGSKIMSVRKAAGLSRRAFAEAIDDAETKVHNIETGHQRADHQFVSKLAKAFQLDANWLIDDTLGMADVAVNYTDFIPITRYDIRVSAGTGAAIVDQEEIGSYAFKRDWILRKGLDPDHLRVVMVTGDSMIPHLNDGDLVLIDHAQDNIVDGRTFVLRFDDQLFVKKVQLAPGRILHLISANAEYPPISLDLSSDDANITIIGRVVASMHEWI
jgi:phage repressor protein C with HTH and peptisase S24 domain